MNLLSKKIRSELAMAGEPTLLTLDETRTLFHEFGHALHGLLSNVKYIRTSGTSVDRHDADVPEFPGPGCGFRCVDQEARALVSCTT